MNNIHPKSDRIFYHVKKFAPGRKVTEQAGESGIFPERENFSGERSGKDFRELVFLKSENKLKNRNNSKRIKKIRPKSDRIFYHVKKFAPGRKVTEQTSRAGFSLKGKISAASAAEELCITKE